MKNQGINSRGDPSAIVLGHPVAANLTKGRGIMHNLELFPEPEQPPERKFSDLAEPMKIQRIGQEFWVIGGELQEPMGPYARLSDAQDDLEGVERFWQNENRSGWVSVVAV
jgi:hypothetical protein